MRKPLIVTPQPKRVVSVDDDNGLASALLEAQRLSKSLEMLGLITLEAEPGRLLSLVIGDPIESVLTFQASFDPPYYVSKGLSEDEEPVVDCYLQFEHHTEFCRNDVIPRHICEQAAHEFLRTRLRPDCVQWREV